MGVSGISGSTSYDEWALIQAQKEKEQTNTEQAGAADSSQVTAIENTVDSLPQSEKVLNITNTDSVEISSEGRAYQQNLQSADAGAPEPAVSSASAETGETSTDLSSLTEDEIRDLVDEGTITQAEANVELARRAAEEAEKNTAPEEQNQKDQYIDEE